MQVFCNKIFNRSSSCHQDRLKFLLKVYVNTSYLLTSYLQVVDILDDPAEVIMIRNSTKRQGLVQITTSLPMATDEACFLTLGPYRKK